LLDRFDRRHVILADNLIRGVVVALIPFLYARGQLALWHVYTVAGIYDALMMIPLAGGPALVPDLVPKRYLDTANALETLSFTLASVIGPPLAGLLISRVGAPNVVIVDALTYFAFALAIVFVKLPKKEEILSSVANTAYRLKDALQLLTQNKILLSTTLMFMTFNLGLGLMLVWLPIYADQVLGGGAELYGILLGFVAAGEVISSILVGGLIFSFSLGVLICLSQFLAGVSLSLLLFRHDTWWSILSLTLLGLYQAPLTIWAQTLRMQIIPEKLRGRTFALLRTLMQSASPVGGIIAGYLLPVVGIFTMIGFSVGLMGIPGVLGYRVKDLRSGDKTPAEDPVY